ncbi:MAG: PDZ domain-containing protein, partial [Actinobacteria bacterium]|nr:PDZ domain-containing protein [Actinomycetota bacterium]
MTEAPVAEVFGPRPRRGRRGTVLLIALIALLALVALAVFLPVPYVKIAPGPTFNTIGEIGGRPLVEIGESTRYPTYPVTGNLNMTTIQEWGGPRGGLTVFQAVAAWLDQSDAVLPRELLYPDDETKDDVERRNAEMFSTSQSNAIAAALTYANIPVTAQVTVTMVVEDTPAAGKLRAGDHVLTLDGVAVTDSQQIGDAIRGSSIGTTFVFGVERAGENVSVSVASADNPEDPG